MPQPTPKQHQATRQQTTKELSRERGPVVRLTQNTNVSSIVFDTTYSVSIVGIGVWLLVVGFATTPVDALWGHGIDSFSPSIPVNAAPLRFASSLVTPLMAVHVLISLSALARMGGYLYEKVEDTEKAEQADPHEIIGLVPGSFQNEGVGVMPASFKDEGVGVMTESLKNDKSASTIFSVNVTSSTKTPDNAPSTTKAPDICTITLVRAICCAVLGAVHLALVLAYIDWGDDASGTPVRLLLMGGVVYAANEVTVRILTDKMFTIDWSLMTARHILHATAFAVALVAFEWIPVFQRSTDSESLPVADFCNDIHELPVVTASSWIFMDGFQGAWAQYAPSSAPAAVVTLLVASGEIIGAVRLFRVTEWGGVDVEFWHKSELWARYAIVAAIAALVVFELYAHTARMQHDPLQSNGRECAYFMQRSLGYFAASGIQLEEDCASSLVYPVHCAGCLHGGFGVATLGEDLTSSAKVLTVFAVWLVVDGAVAGAGCVKRMYS